MFFVFFSLQRLESLLKTLTKTFHTNHFLVLSLKQKLLTEYRRELTSPNPQKKTLLRMLELCKEIFSVLQIVEPGISRLKGMGNCVAKNSEVCIFWIEKNSMNLYKCFCRYNAV